MLTFSRRYDFEGRQGSEVDPLRALLFNSSNETLCIKFENEDMSGWVDNLGIPVRHARQRLQSKMEISQSKVLFNRDELKRDAAPGYRDVVHTSWSSEFPFETLTATERAAVTLTFYMTPFLSA